MFGPGGGSRSVGVRRKLEVVLKHYPLLPVIVLVLFTAFFIFPVSPGNMLAIALAMILTLGLIVYQNVMQVHGE